MRKRSIQAAAGELPLLSTFVAAHNNRTGHACSSGRASEDDGSNVSEAGVVIAAAGSPLPAPSRAAVAQLFQTTRACEAAGGALLDSLREAAHELGLAGGALPAPHEARALLDRAADVHGSVLAADDALEEGRVSAAGLGGLDECRRWLRGVQDYALALSRRLSPHVGAPTPGAAAAAAAAPAGAAAAAESEEEEGPAGSGSCSSSGAAAAEAAWRTLCADASAALGRCADAMEAGGVPSAVTAAAAAALGGGSAGGGGSGSGSARSSFERAAGAGGKGGGGGTGGGSRLVARASRLSYSQHWSKRIAL